MGAMDNLIVVFFILGKKVSKLRLQDLFVHYERIIFPKVCHEDGIGKIR